MEPSGRHPWVDAKFWMIVLSDIHNRAPRDVFFVVSDGPKGLP
jgi:transposase-like protein